MQMKQRFKQRRCQKESMPFKTSFKGESQNPHLAGYPQDIINGTPTCPPLDSILMLNPFLRWIR